MKRFAALLAVLALTETTGFAQYGPRQFSRPTPPTNAELNRLHLRLGWRNRIPMADGRDRIVSIQVLGGQLLVQTKTGLMALLNAETGQVIWRVRSRAPHEGQHALGHNYNTIFGYNHNYAFGLSRFDGQVKFIFELSNIPSAPPVADAERLFCCLTGGRLLVYDLTNPIPARTEHGAPGENLFVPRELEPPERNMDPLKPKGYATDAPSTRGKPLTAIGPHLSAGQAARGNEATFALPLLWHFRVNRRLELPPVLTPRSPHDPGFVLLGSTDGSFTIGLKTTREIVFGWESGSMPVAPITRNGHEAYIALEDGSVIAMTLQLQRNLTPGKILWRAGTGAAIERRLAVTDEDVFATPTHRGLLRFRRDNGERLWRSPEAVRFLAESKKFVFALDRRGYLLALDRPTGKILSRLDTRDFTIAVENDYTDRIYLAANDGQIISLHDRNHPKPLWNKKYVEDEPTHGKGKRPAEEKEEMPKKEMEKKEAEKKEAKE